ncbi:MAG: YraN family protein [Anaerolineae bacterium]|nr:YraN family protein [Anaerolineae bacterium]
MSTAELGRWAEEVATQALAAYDYRVICRNWRSTHGEIDIVAREAGMWVFVEVKARTGVGRGLPEEAVTASKQVRLIELARAYLAAQGIEDTAWRIDVLALELTADRKVRRLTIHRDAVRD